MGMYQPHTFSSVLRVFMQGDGPVNHYREESSPANNMTASDPTERRLPLINFQFVASTSEGGQNTGVIIAVVLVLSVLLLALVAGGVALRFGRASRIGGNTGNEGRNRERSQHQYDLTVHVGRRSISATDAPKAAGMDTNQ